MPKSIREELNLKAGNKLEFVMEGKETLLTLDRRRYERDFPKLRLQ